MMSLENRERQRVRMAGNQIGRGRIPTDSERDKLRIANTKYPKEDGVLRCGRCKEYKPLSEFSKGRSKGGSGWYCKDCAREYNLKYKYGLSKEKYEKMYNEQGGKCLICQNHFDVLYTDHRHGGDVRGLLCSKCNTAIGLLGDDPAIIARASEYLKRYDSNA
jgi:hypothetical protein